MFDFLTNFFDKNQIQLDSAGLEIVSLKQFTEVAKFDFGLSFFLNSSQNRTLVGFQLDCSRDCFNENTAEIIARRMKRFCDQSFASDKNGNELNASTMPLARFDIMLSEEANEIRHIEFTRESRIKDEGPASYAQARIWLDERTRFDPDKPQLAIYNMPFLYRLATGSSLSVQQL
ncbi:unnamed protein product, partial [Adineta ricciae]